MRAIKNISRKLKQRVIDALIRAQLHSGHFRRSVLRRLYSDYMAAGALAYVQFPDHAMLVDPRDHMIAFRLVEGNAWQRAEFDSAVAITSAAGALKAGGWCIDVGANIGTQTIYALLSGKFKGVIAIEPEPHNAQLLRRNIALNGFTERVHVIEAAASAGDGFAELARDAANFGAHTLEQSMPMQESDRITVRKNTIDQMLAELGIAPGDVSLVLIDVEGHEIEALKGMQSLREQRVPIVIEVTAAAHGDAGIQELRNLLLSHYGLVTKLAGRGGQGPVADAAALSSYDFGLRQSDVLVYNAAKPAVGDTR